MGVQKKKGKQLQQGNILFSGVGGQGILLASEIMAYALLAAGYDAKKSEVHGMAQRGGSVTAQLRYGDKVYSPLIEPGRADIQVAFEMMEAVRYLPYLHKDSTVIVNTQKILPPAVATGKTTYPENVLDHITAHGIKVVLVDAFDLAREVGEVRTANVVMVGAVSAFLPMAASVYEEIISARVPAKFRDVNLKAFAAGRKLSEG
jgi:indolepyruvate ferredoxin oxidoreductase beta subunit